MDCCDANEKSEYSNNMERENMKFSFKHISAYLKGGKSIKMEKRIWLWIITGILFVAVLFLVFKAGGATETVVQSAGSAAKSASSSASSYGGMVGGC